jgi:hypothetical protein
VAQGALWQVPDLRAPSHERGRAGISAGEGLGAAGGAQEDGLRLGRPEQEEGTRAVIIGAQ